MDTVTSNWSSLPQDLLISIAKRLHTRLDILRLRAVCRSFRSTLPPPPPNVLFPKSILRNFDFLRGPNPNDYDLFLPVESTLYAIQPLQNETSQTWLIKVEQSSIPGRVQIKDPLSGYRFKRKLSKLRKSLNLLDYRVKEISRSYTLESAAIRKGKAKLFDENERDSNPFGKVIFSSFLDEADDEFAVMAKFGENQLSMWRSIDKKWTNLDLNIEFSEVHFDIVYDNQKFYAASSNGLTIAVDFKSLTVTEVAARLQEDPVFMLLCWVESFNSLLSVVEYEDYNSDDEYYLKFYELNEEKREWVPMVDGSKLEDKVFFFSESCLYSASAKEFSGCRGNSLYFTDEDSDSEADHPGQAARIVDLKEAARTDPKDRESKKLSEFPGYSNLFWPPPTWLN